MKQYATIGELGHHVGLHVDVNLQGKTVGAIAFDEEHWASGAILGMSEMGTYVTVKLDVPIGGGAPHGILRRPSSGQQLVSIDDPARVRVKDLAEVIPDGVPETLLELARTGKPLEAIKQYRALTGATLDEAKAWLRTV